MNNCIFCKIVSGDLPSYRVYEDENVLAFLDIAPVHPGHVLVIPKKHYANIEEIPEDLLFEVMRVVKRAGWSIKKTLNYKGYNIQENNDPIAGQIVPHLHFHIIPRIESDGLKLWPQGEYKDGEAGDIANKLKINI